MPKPKRVLYKVVKCMGCGAKKRLPLVDGSIQPEQVRAFEADGWMWKYGSRGYCKDCNLFNA